MQQLKFREFLTTQSGMTKKNRPSALVIEFGRSLTHAIITRLITIDRTPNKKEQTWRNKSNYVDKAITLIFNNGNNLSLTISSVH